MLTEYYFSVFPTPDVQAAQLSNYIRGRITKRQRLPESFRVWNYGRSLFKYIKRFGRFNALSLSREKRFFHILQPVVHGEVFLALKMAREANLDARAISEEDTLLFFKRIVAKLHGVNLNKEFTDPKKKQENAVKAITSGETTPTKGSEKSKGKGPAAPKGNKGKGKGKRNDRSQRR